MFVIPAQAEGALQQPKAGHPAVQSSIVATRPGCRLRSGRFDVLPATHS